MKHIILKQCQDLSLSEIKELREDLLEIYKEKFKTLYTTVRIHPGERIEEKIKSETGFYCYHEPSNSYSTGRGTHVIVIPKDVYSDELKNDLTSKYDDK